MVSKTKKIKENLNNSFYFNKIKTNKEIIIVSLILAIICTMIAYPGIWYSDSYGRVYSSIEIKNAAKQILLGNRNSINIESWLTFVPSIIMAICTFLTGNIATYTILQAFMFFLFTFLFIKKMKTYLYKLQYVLFALSPLIYCVSVYYEAGIGCITGIIAIILLLDNIKIKKSKLDQIIELILLMLFSFITFGYRANAFTILPVLIIYILLIKTNKMKKILTASALICGMILISVSSWILNIKTLSSASAGFTWEIIRVIQEMPPEKKEEYIDYLDDICGEGSTKMELELTDNDTVNGFLSSKGGITQQNLSESENPKKILKKYINIIIKEPELFFKVKLDFTKRTLGINKPITYIGFFYNYENRMKNYNFSDSSRRREFVDVYEKTNEVFCFYTRRPWLVLLISACLVIIKWKQKDERRGLYMLILMTSVFYYLAYIINTQAFQIRYFYPSLYLCMILTVGISMDLIHDISIKIKNKLNHKSNNKKMKAK